MITHLRKVNYVPTTKLKQIDPKLTTFLNINTPRDMRKAEETILAMQSKPSKTLYANMNTKSARALWIAGNEKEKDLSKSLLSTRKATWS